MISILIHKVYSITLFTVRNFISTVCAVLFAFMYVLNSVFIAFEIDNQSCGLYSGYLK